MIPIKDAKMILEAELKARSDAYYDYLQAGGKGDCAEETWLEAIEIAIKALQEPEIVHCKDCKCWIDAEYGKGTEDIKQCSLAGYLIGERGYCLYGVKAGE